MNSTTPTVHTKVCHVTCQKIGSRVQLDEVVDADEAAGVVDALVALDREAIDWIVG